MILEVCWDGLYTLSIGLSQFHGYGSWHVCEVARRSLFNHDNNRKLNIHMLSSSAAAQESLFASKARKLVAKVVWFQIKSQHETWYNIRPMFILLKTMLINSN